MNRAPSRGGRALELTPKEFALLEYLLRHQGQAISRAMTESAGSDARRTWSSTVA